MEAVRVASNARCGDVLDSDIQGGKVTDWWGVEDGVSLFKQLGYTILALALAKV